jgi:hypothetical protein
MQIMEKYRYRPLRYLVSCLFRPRVFITFSGRLRASLDPSIFRVGSHTGVLSI